jgi:hypothetical protein
MDMCMHVLVCPLHWQAVMPYITFMSDGGHTENTAMFPLLYEQKPLIVCVDSGADPSYKLDDVLQCISMARTHLGCSFEPLLLPTYDAGGEARTWPLSEGNTEDYLRTTLDQGRSRVAALRVQYPGRDSEGQPVVGVGECQTARLPLAVG